VREKQSNVKNYTLTPSRRVTPSEFAQNNFEDKEGEAGSGTSFSLLLAYILHIVQMMSGVGAGIDAEKFRGAQGRRLELKNAQSEENSQEGAMNGTNGAPVSTRYRFVQIADTQFGMMGQIRNVQWVATLRKALLAATCDKVDLQQVLPVPELAGRLLDVDPEALLELEIEMSRKAVKVINRLDPLPRFVVVCGDLVNAFPSAADLHRKEVEIFKQVWSQLDKRICLVCVCGNHDIGDRPRSSTIANYKNSFGDDYFRFEVGRDRFIVLNSQLFKDPSKCKKEAQEQEQWLDHALEQSSTDSFRHSVAFMHVPPFIKDPNERHGAFNLPNLARLRLLGKLAANGFSHVFCGHYHRNAVSHISIRGKRIEVVTTGAVGGNISTDPRGDPLDFSGMGIIDVDDTLSGIRIVEMGPEGISHSFHTLRDQRTKFREERENFTPEEDEVILQGLKQGKDWDSISSSLPRQRSQSVVKSRYRILRDEKDENNR